MPTNKPIVSVVFDEDVLEEVDDYRFANRVSSRSKAINDLIRIGLDNQSKQKEKEQKENR